MAKALVRYYEGISHGRGNPIPAPGKQVDAASGVKTDEVTLAAIPSGASVSNAVPTGARIAKISAGTSGLRWRFHTSTTPAVEADDNYLAANDSEFVEVAEGTYFQAGTEAGV